MKKIDLGQTTSILANIGVIAGILFLGYELRQNNQLMSADANMRLLDNRLTYFEQIALSDGVAEAIVKRENGEALTEVESFKLRNIDIATWIKWDWEFGRYLDGYITIDQLPVSGWRANLRAERGLMDVWINHRDFADPSPEFVEFVNDEVIRD